MNKLDQKGFSLVEGLLIVVAVLLLGFGGYYVYDQNTKDDNIAVRVDESLDSEEDRVMSRSELIDLIEKCEVRIISLTQARDARREIIENERVVTVVYENNIDADGEFIIRAYKADPDGYPGYVEAAKRSSIVCETDISYLNQFGDNDPDSSGHRWITDEEATLLLNDCEIKTFTYTDSELGEVEASGVDTGIKLVDYGFVKHIYVSESQESTMIPIARSSQSVCDGKPQFWHDGRYEN